MTTAAAPTKTPTALIRLDTAGGFLVGAPLMLFLARNLDGWKFFGPVSLAAFLVLMAILGLLGVFDYAAVQTARRR
jgi:hypothetical protein